MEGRKCEVCTLGTWRVGGGRFLLVGTRSEGPSVRFLHVGTRRVGSVIIVSALGTRRVVSVRFVHVGTWSVGSVRFEHSKH